jgi:hypothetical protein
VPDKVTNVAWEREVDMNSGSSQPSFALEIDGSSYSLREAEFNGVLFDLVTTLVFEKQADRCTFILATAETELTGSGGVHFDPLSVSLYRHLKVERCHGPSYPELGGEAQSFRLHSIAGALVAVAFFLKAGDMVPHFLVGFPDRDVLTVLDRGERTRLNVDEPRLVKALTRLIPK